MGVGSTTSRVQRQLVTDAEGQSTDYYLYKLHEGDSIIGECRVFDSDAVSTDKQYSQTIKVQVVQSGDGSHDGTTGAPIEGGIATWDGNKDRVQA